MGREEAEGRWGHTAPLHPPPRIRGGVGLPGSSHLPGECRQSTQPTCTPLAVPKVHPHLSTVTNTQRDAQPELVPCRSSWRREKSKGCLCVPCGHGLSTAFGITINLHSPVGAGRWHRLAPGGGWQCGNTHPLCLVWAMCF